LPSPRRRIISDDAPSIDDAIGSLDAPIEFASAEMRMRIVSLFVVDFRDSERDQHLTLHVTQREFFLVKTLLITFIERSYYMGDS